MIPRKMLDEIDIFIKISSITLHSHFWENEEKTIMNYVTVRRVDEKKWSVQWKKIDINFSLFHKIIKNCN